MKCTELRDELKSFINGVKRTKRCHNTSDVKWHHRWVHVTQLLKLSSIFGGRRKHVFHGLRNHRLERRSGDYAERYKKGFKRTRFCLKFIYVYKCLFIYLFVLLFFDLFIQSGSLSSTILAILIYLNNDYHFLHMDFLPVSEFKKLGMIN